MGVLEGLEQGQTQKVKGQDQQGTLLSLWPRISPLRQAWHCGVLETPGGPELRSAVFVRARIPSLDPDSDILALAIAN